MAGVAVGRLQVDVAAPVATAAELALDRFRVACGGGGCRW